MKIKIAFKSPDGFAFAISEYAADELNSGRCQINDIPGVRAALEERLEKWVKYGELVTVEFDIDAMTATVLPAQ